MQHFKDVREGTPRILPKWLMVNADALTATVSALPTREDIDLTLQENLIVEFYSR
jgi:small subunit ribosomal protein S4